MEVEIKLENIMKPLVIFMKEHIKRMKKIFLVYIIGKLCFIIYFLKIVILLYKKTKIKIIKYNYLL